MFILCPSMEWKIIIKRRFQKERKTDDRRRRLRRCEHGTVYMSAKIEGRRNVIDSGKMFFFLARIMSDNIECKRPYFAETIGLDTQKIFIRTQPKK